MRMKRKKDKSTIDFLHIQSILYHGKMCFMDASWLINGIDGCFTPNCKIQPTQQLILYYSFCCWSNSNCFSTLKFHSELQLIEREREKKSWVFFVAFPAIHARFNKQLPMFFDRDTQRETKKLREFNWNGNQKCFSSMFNALLVKRIPSSWFSIITETIRVLRTFMVRW